MPNVEIYVTVHFHSQVELSDLQTQIEKRQGGLDATYKKYDAEMNGFYHIDMTLSGTAPTNSSLTSNPPQQLKLDKEVC